MDSIIWEVYQRYGKWCGHSAFEFSDSTRSFEFSDNTRFNAILRRLDINYWSDSILGRNTRSNTVIRHGWNKWKGQVATAITNNTNDNNNIIAVRIWTPRLTSIGFYGRASRRCHLLLIMH